MAMTPSSSSRPVVGVRGEGGDSPAVGVSRESGEGQGAAGRVPGANDGVTAVLEPALSAEPLDVVGMLAGVHHPAAGAVVLFSGEVRDNNRGMAVSHLEYEAHGPLAEKVIAEILSAARSNYPLQIAIARHRTGRVAIGETAVVVITASAHRKEAYAANQYIIDRIKQEAPIWKREYFMDGASQWGTPDGARE